MHDPWNPTTPEIREWAYSTDAVEPCQDWDLALSWAQYVPVYIEFVADPRCPSRDYFLHVLYFMVGDAVRTEFRNTPRPIVEGWLEKHSEFLCAELSLWADRSWKLLRDPASFDYEYWCGWGHEAG